LTAGLDTVDCEEVETGGVEDEEEIAALKRSDFDGVSDAAGAGVATGTGELDDTFCCHDTSVKSISRLTRRRGRE